jgi:putative oxidoreductase
LFLRLLINQFVPLSLAILAPIIVNILIFHIAMQPGTVALILWIVLASRLWSHFAPLLTQKTTVG